MKNISYRINTSLIALTLIGATPAWAQSLTAPQKNAVRSANQYLSVQVSLAMD
ncbi:hypothetical protein [Delftia sp. HK171]|uniref:hypothetical protein n=1 Tax=Delftia sp. HK171 TaxID=1920191 RepID=UPI001E5FD24F|nr:hypothetical protein [Delftia sp. HK171]